MPRIYVPMLPEFDAVARIAATQPNVAVTPTALGYYIVESAEDLVFRRRELGFKPALWYSCFSGGIEGRIAEYGRDEVRITSA